MILRPIFKIAGWIALFVVNALAFWSVTSLFSLGFESLGVVLILTMVVADFIIFNRKAYPYRYVLPALVLLFVLVIYPIYFTINTAFTNFGTGHIFTREEVIERLLMDPQYTFKIEEEPSYFYTVFTRYEGITPTEDFIILFQRTDGSLYVTSKPRPVIKRGNVILLSEGELRKIDKGEFQIGGRRYELVPWPANGLTGVKLVKMEETVYKPLYSPDNPSLSHNEGFFKSCIGQKYLANAEYKAPDGTLALRIASDNTWRFFRIQRLYSITYKEMEKDGRRELQSVIVNNRTGKPLIESDGTFYDVNEDGESVFVAGYIDYVGTRNFKRIVEDPNVAKPFLKIFTWTFVWASLSVVFTFAVGLSFALVLNDPTLRGRVIYRTLLIIPWAVPAFISVLVWRNGMFNETYGIINKVVLPLLGLGRIKWFNDPFWAKVACLIVNTWLGFPYMMTVSLGALQSIPNELYEAAAIDGAGKLHRFSKITFPLLTTTVAPLLVGSFAFNFNNFVNIYLLTQGGPALPNTTTPAGATDILISYTYKLSFEGGRGQDFGFASAISLIIFAIVAGISFVNFKLSGAFEEVSR